MRRHLRKYARKTWVQHLGFWVLSYLILTGAFATAWPVAKADFIYTLLFHISLVTAVYVHLRLLLPLLIQRRQAVLYVVGAIALVFGAVLGNEYTFTYLSDWIFPGFYFVSDYTRGEIALFVGLFLILTTSLKFSKSWITLQRTRLELEATRRANIETELMALRAQVNPHFLFNSLHSIYALALERSEQTPEMILQLSNVLRFMLYEADKKLIKLDQEIACISEFVALQKARLHEEATVTWEPINRCPEARIAPLLLMPLVDNTFKHGLIGEHTEITLELSCVDGILTFDSRNRLPRNTSEDQEERPGGIGLANVRRRLQLSYPGRHKLHIDQSENAYHVTLKVTL
jgi:hypothetical protein